MTTMELGGNIELTGFSNVRSGEMIILKKIIGNYANRFNLKAKNFEKLALTLKSVHKKQFELHAKMLSSGKTLSSEMVERNIFVGLDGVLKKIMHRMQ